MMYSSLTSTASRSLLPLADFRSRVLILDVVPGEKSKILSQYYANKGNSFWKIIFHALREPSHSDYKLKRQILLKNGVALWNVLETEDIGYEQPNDFQSFFQMYPSIQKIVFNGNNAAECFARHIGFQRGINYSTLPSTSSLNTWKSMEEKAAIWLEELRKSL
jgi:hypoxanthine-DNA glycosylase